LIAPGRGVEVRIEIEETGSKGRYVIYGDDGGRAGEMTFSKAGTTRIIIDHTAVSDAYRGKGVGPELVARAVADARAAGKRIVPLCPYAAAQFRRHADWADVLAD
jgi:predicted GNAT family acetyltransferase